MIIKQTVSCLFALLFAMPVLASASIDSATVPVKSTELATLIRSEPIASNQHNVLISRACYSGFATAKKAYEEYTSIWKKTPTNFSANLRRGAMASAYLSMLMSPIIEKPNDISKNKTQIAAELMRTTQKCLEKATELNPKNGEAKATYGYYLFYWGSQIDKGITLLKEAVNLSPKDRRVRRLFAETLSNPGTRYYSASKAETEFRASVKLDSDYAAPYRGLAELYCQTKQPEKAKQALQMYKALTL